MTKAYLLGFIAGQDRNKSRRDCPYDLSNEEDAWQQWAEGYTDASEYWCEPLKLLVENP